jgi:two-component system heavy metal sensor histidine kinase CusS
MVDSSRENQSDSLNVPWTNVISFIRQLSHDLRNDLNAIELQSTYLDELGKNEQFKTEIKGLREMVSRLASTLQRLSRVVGEVSPTLIPYRATDLMEDMRATIEHDFPKESREITWDIQLGHTMLNVDPQLLQEVFTEFFANAFRHNRGKGPILARARVDNNEFLFTLQEPKAQFELSTENWGCEPLRKTGQRHYGLGLNRVRTIIEAHGGKLHAQYDPDVSALITTLTLPASREASEEA